MTAAVALSHSYTPRGVAQDLFSDRSRQVLVSGPAGTGKSRACMEKINMVCLLRPGTRVLMVRKTLASLTATGLVTWRDKVVPELLAAGGVRFFGGNKEQPAQYKYRADTVNGTPHRSVVVVGGMDKPTKIMSGEYDLIYVQEATELDEDDWQALSTRLRNGRLSYHQLMGDCNPDAPTHWLYQRCQNGKTRNLESTHLDNPQFYDLITLPDGTIEHRITRAGRDYIEGVLGDLVGVYRDRYLDGRWTAAEGQIFTQFVRKLHVVNRPEFDPSTPVCSAGMPSAWPRTWCIDFGYTLTHPFVLQRWAQDPAGGLWLYGEQHMTGRTVEDHVADLKGIVFDAKGNWTEPRPRKILADHDAEDRATFTKHFGHATSPADKRVKIGLQACMTRFKPLPNGRPGVFFVNGAIHEVDPRLVAAKRPTTTIDEIPSYVWMDNGKEAPVKDRDDGMDCFRYVVADFDLRGEPRIRSFNASPRVPLGG